jgi:hypothetical protein
MGVPQMFFCRMVRRLQRNRRDEKYAESDANRCHLLHVELFLLAVHPASRYFARTA